MIIVVYVHFVMKYMLVQTFTRNLISILIIIKELPDIGYLFSQFIIIINSV